MLLAQVNNLEQLVKMEDLVVVEELGLVIQVDKEVKVVLLLNQLNQEILAHMDLEMLVVKDLVLLS
jgi:hypothetical protein